jgi:CheY-like chemotaxis protein
MAGHVLLADDDPDCRAVVARVLSADGYEVTQLGDGASVLQRLAAAADGRAPMPDVLLLDFCMPGFSGIGVMRVLSKVERMPPAIVITAFPDPSIERYAGRFRIAKVLRKPVDLDELLAAIAEVIA